VKTKNRVILLCELALESQDEHLETKNGKQSHTTYLHLATL